MAVVLTYSSGVPVVKVGRIAGQFAKPRSAPIERVGDIDLPCVPRPHGQRRRTDRGGAHARRRAARAGLPPVGVDAEPGSGVHEGRVRRPLPRRCVEPGVRGVEPRGPALPARSRPRSSARCGSWRRAASISARSPQLHEVDFYTSHEALILGYEEALTRTDSLTGRWYDCSAHMLWIGERTRRLDGAHVEFLRGVGNPIGCKVGPTATPSEVLELCERLNPERVPGPAHADRPHGRRASRGAPAPTAAGSDRRRAPGRVGVRPDARQHVHELGQAARRGTSTTCSRRSTRSFGRTLPRARGRAACTSSSPVTT